MSQADLNSVLLSVLASAIFQFIYSTSSVLYNKFKSGFSQAPLSVSSSFITMWITPAALMLALILFLTKKIDVTNLCFFSIYVLALAFIVLRREVYKFRQVGIVGVDVNISKGIDYQKALKLTKRNLKVLGTGADKLTSLEKEFNEAISAASRQQRAKLLLCHPESKALLEMAVSDGKQPNEYVDNVRTSLSRLKRIHLGTEKLEIRFYKAETPEEMPTFRLMFFNEHYCLCSFNSFGNKDKGTSAPQLHLRCPTDNNGKFLYYRAFENYFEDLWKQSDKYKIFEKEDWDKFGI